MKNITTTTTRSKIAASNSNVIMRLKDE